MNSELYPKIYLYQRIIRAKIFIDSNYGEKIDLENISDEASFSKFHFIRLFKQIYGKSPHQYLIITRIEKAKVLLQNGMNVSEVCYSVGFDSVSTFSGLFTKLVCKTPSNYSNHYKERKTKIKTTPAAFIPSCYSYMHGWMENSNFEDENK
ncbi:helix-turn-helix domain-containing protein [Flavobacterium sp.]|uniref:helix-turn-helix domain-containing protein n=1 Tax=Flavobacterium sp. TaxID=239 RepID=UPI003C40F850